MESKMFKNIINFPGVNFDSVLFYILHLMSVANKITGWYYVAGEAHLYDTGVASADKNISFRSFRQFSSSRAIVKQKNKSLAILKFSDTLKKMNEKILLEDVMIQTCTEKNKIESPWITGFFDGEGSFVVCVVKDNKRDIGWRTTLNIKIGLHEKDRAILELIKKLLGGRTNL